uniref:Uncharacterized protein n=1 Tax=Rhizophora mucronata TaxID=61149 RepID=A0A2P2QU43_RHIMU
MEKAVMERNPFSFNSVFPFFSCISYFHGSAKIFVI